MRDQYIRSGGGFLVVFSITDRNTFGAVDLICKKILSVKGIFDLAFWSLLDTNKFPMVVVGNKCDLESEREVLTEDGRKVAREFQIPYIETSAKTRFVFFFFFICELLGIKLRKLFSQ